MTKDDDDHPQCIRLEGLGPLRSHQTDAYTVAVGVVTRGGSGARVTVAAVTPGGGKTLMASIFAHVLLSTGYVTQVIVVCPRDTLRTQMKNGFTDRTRGLTHRLAAPSNASLHQRCLHERSGYVTTIQAIASALKKHLKMVKAAPTLLVIDEGHHLADEERRGWRDAISVLVAEAKHVLFMSGTLLRHDRAAIPFIPYDSENKPVADIRYNRREALTEHAILPVSVQVVDGRAEFWHSCKRHSIPSLLAAPKADQRGALRTLLERPEYRDTMLVQALAEWMKYRESVYVSRAIVLCKSQKDARAVAHAIRAHFHVDVCLAVSEDGEISKRALSDFRDKRIGEVLVTVAMAYEGLDVPDCTHLVCLTNIRSWPWLEQAFARVTRHNGRCGLPWEKQEAFLYVPSDAEMLAYLDGALQEQDEHFEEMKVGAAAGAARRASTFSPISGETNGAVVYATENGVMSEEESELVKRLTREYPLMSIMPVPTLLDIAKRMRSGAQVH